ncbi:MAG: YkgJ family cysteine cluster protein [Eubacterium sp.]
MKRDITLKEISDGRLYTANDMVKADCHDCVGCSACCHGMGKSIVLDPLDIYRFCYGVGMDFAALMNGKIELNIVDGLTLPNLKMSGENKACEFLDENGRCSVHKFRPGICRMFPLGRYYEGESFKYFLQVHECPVKNKGKVKVKKWVDITDLKQYEQYINDWHQFLVNCNKASETLGQQQMKILHLFILKTFYQESYKEGFYDDFYDRLHKAKSTLGI